MSAINELRVRTKEKAKVEEKLQQLLFELNQTLTVEPQDAKQVRVKRCSAPGRSGCWKSLRTTCGIRSAAYWQRLST